MSKEIDYNCEKTWELFHDGKTKGVFQLESSLGKSWSKKLKPSNMEELSALIALIRPGCLKAISNGKSMTQRYIDRKNGLEDVEYLHESLEDVLKPTYGVLVYQEQSMRIAQKLAGFDLQEADVLRKAIGKKKADLMAQVKKDFIKGCKAEKIVPEEVAEEIFSWIEKSSRYSFNKSHAVAYGMCSYWSAHHKVHNTKEFFLAYLYHANEKQDAHEEVYELVGDAKLFDIPVKTPNITNFSEKFSMNKGAIYFGIKDIKSLTGKTGDKAMAAVRELCEELNKQAKSLSWMEVLIFLSTKINSTAFKALASVGFFRGFKDKITRNRALYEYEIYRGLTKAESTWVRENYASKRWKTLSDCLEDLAPTKKQGGGTSKEARSQHVKNEIHFLANPPYDLSDDPSWIVDQEVKFLGCPVSMSKIETSDTSAANTSCKEIMDGKQGKNMMVAGNIKRVADYKIKRGKSKGKYMSFLTIEDDSCSLDSVIVFPECRDKFQHWLYEGNNLLFSGSVSKQDTSFVVSNIFEI
jgi:DNA polymerase III alpha subunit|tara:strand:+ start:10228 stop:11799 length:1572 start_codon:yes stop_codon:yes gene_type:complete